MIFRLRAVRRVFGSNSASRPEDPSQCGGNWQFGLGRKTQICCLRGRWTFCLRELRARCLTSLTNSVARMEPESAFFPSCRLVFAVVDRRVGPVLRLVPVVAAFVAAAFDASGRRLHHQSLLVDHLAVELAGLVAVYDVFG